MSLTLSEQNRYMKEYRKSGCKVAFRKLRDSVPIVPNTKDMITKHALVKANMAKSGENQERPGSASITQLNFSLTNDLSHYDFPYRHQLPRSTKSLFPSTIKSTRYDHIKPKVNTWNSRKCRRTSLDARPQQKTSKYPSPRILPSSFTPNFRRPVFPSSCGACPDLSEVEWPFPVVFPNFQRSKNPILLMQKFLAKSNVFLPFPTQTQKLHASKTGKSKKVISIQEKEIKKDEPNSSPKNHSKVPDGNSGTNTAPAGKGTSKMQ